jgi:plastocyanin
MTSTSQRTGISVDRISGDERGWTRLLVWTSVVTAVVDLAAPALAGAVIPPLAVGAALTVVGLLVVRRRPFAGVVTLGVVNLLLVVSSAPFAAPNLLHPDSPLSFSHASISLLGRTIAVVAAVGAWRRVPQGAARKLTIAAAGLLGITAMVAISATIQTGGEARAPGDVPVRVANAAFPAEVRVSQGGTLLFENRDLVRHTFTVEGTGVSRELPERSTVRIGVELEPGTYRFHCEVPGHESMTGQLLVR